MASCLGRLFQSRWTFLVILVLGLAIRLAVAVAADGPVKVGNSDETVLAAQQLLDGDLTDPLRPPGLAIYLASFFSLFGDSPAVATAAMLVLHVLLTVLVYVLGSALADRRAGNIAALLVALTPSLVLVSVSTQAYLLVATALAAGVYLTLLSHLRFGPLLALAGGVAFGIAVLAEPFVIVLALIWPGYLLIRRHRAAAAVLSLVGVLVVVGAWAVQVHRQTDRWVFVNHGWGKTVFLGNNEWTPMYRTWYLGSARPDFPGFDDFEAVAAIYERHPLPMQMDMFRDHGLAYIADRPDLFAARIASRLRGFFGFQTLGGATVQGQTGSNITSYGVMALDALLWAIVALGTVYLFMLPSPGPGHSDAARSLGRLIVLFAVPYWLFYAHGNHHLGLLPIMAVLTGVAVARRSMVSMAGPAKVRRRWLAVIVLIAFVFVQAEWAYWNMQG